MARNGTKTRRGARWRVKPRDAELRLTKEEKERNRKEKETEREEIRI